MYLVNESSKLESVNRVHEIGEKSHSLLDHPRKYLIVNLVFSYLGFWSENLFLIAPFPDLCLLVPYFLALKYLWRRK